MTPAPGHAPSATTGSAPHADSSTGPAAWRSPAAWGLLLIVLGLGLIADLASKSLAFRHIAGYPVVVTREQVAGAVHLGSLIPPHEPVIVVPRLLEFTLVLNPGAVFGMGAGKRWFFISFTVLAVAFAIWIFSTWTRARDRAAHVGLALLLAGGLGNLFDRLVYGCVRDFIHPLPGAELPLGWHWPWGGREVWPYVSNVADLLLIIGIMLLLIHTWRQGASPPARPKPAPGAN